MNFETIWLQLCHKNNLLLRDETVVEFKSRNLKILLRQVFEQGQKSVPIPEKKNDLTDMINSLFGAK